MKDKILKLIKTSYKYILLIIFIYALLLINLPYVVYAPGGAINLADRIEIKDSNDSKGSFNMAYVSMLKGNIPIVLLSYIIPNWDIVKNTEITYEDEDIESMIETDKVLYEEAINNAIVAAFKEANGDITIKGVKNEVAYIVSYAETNLLVGDILISADNKAIKNLDEYKDIISNHNVGDKINLVVERNNTQKDVQIVVKDNNGEKKTGVAFVSLIDFEINPKIKINIDETESGPSGGLMTALSIYDKLTVKDLTKGLKIVGTGTIDSDGSVGEIGGVKYKVLGAIKEQADIFICPIENYKEAKKVLAKEKSNIKLIGVKTLKEAINKLS